jgi:hypothetical protein
MILLLGAFWLMAYDTPKILSKERTLSQLDGLKTHIGGLPEEEPVVTGVERSTSGGKKPNQKTPLLGHHVVSSGNNNGTTAVSRSDEPLNDVMAPPEDAPIIIEPLESLTLWGSMKTLKYWMQFFTTTFGVGGGLLVIYNITQMVEALGGKDGDQNVYVSLIGVASSSGRLIVGFGSDKYAHVMARPTWYIFCGILMVYALTHLCPSVHVGREVIPVWRIIIIVCVASVLSVFRFKDDVCRCDWCRYVIWWLLGIEWSVCR